jgi:hypothetical protein
MPLLWKQYAQSQKTAVMNPILKAYPILRACKENWLLELMFQFKIVNRRENCNRLRRTGNKKSQVLTPTASFSASSTPAMNDLLFDQALTDSMSTTAQNTPSQTEAVPELPATDLDSEPQSTPEFEPIEFLTADLIAAADMKSDQRRAEYKAQVEAAKNKPKSRRRLPGHVYSKDVRSWYQC